MTWSPFFRLVTPGPVSTTMPAPSWPRMAGKRPSGSAPDSVKASVWQMPVALISTRHSPARGPSRLTVSMVSGAPALRATAARTSMDPPPASGKSATKSAPDPDRQRHGEQHADDDDARLLMVAQRRAGERAEGEHRGRPHQGRADIGNLEGQRLHVHAAGGERDDGAHRAEP